MSAVMPLAADAAERAYRLLQGIADNTSSVIYAKDIDGRYLLVNRQFELLFRLSRAEVLGQTDFDVFPESLAGEFRRNDLRVVETGHLLECEEIAPHSDGNHTYLSIKFPLRDAVGDIYAVAGISTDITERIRTERELDALRRHHELLLESMGDGTLSVDRHGRIEFLNRAAEELLQRTTRELRGVPFAHLMPPHGGDSGSLAALNAVFDVLQGGQRREVPQTLLSRSDGAALPVELVVSPVQHRGEIIGAVLVFRDLRERLEHMRADQEMRAASHVQQFLYPPASPRIPGFDVAGGAYPSSRVCGDYFDFQPWGPDAWCVTVGDVSGHGLGPALHMVETRAFLHAMLREIREPSELLQRLNSILCADVPSGMFVSLFVGRLSTIDRRLSFASAGHPAGLMRANGRIQPLPTSGMPLGLFDRAEYDPAGSLAMEPGDILVVTSDGVAEMLSPARELFGWARLWNVIAAQRAAGAEEIRDAVFRETRRFAQNEPQHDDATILIAKCCE